MLTLYTFFDVPSFLWFTIILVTSYWFLHVHKKIRLHLSSRGPWELCLRAARHFRNARRTLQPTTTILQSHLTITLREAVRQGWGRATLGIWGWFEQGCVRKNWAHRRITECTCHLIHAYMSKCCSCSCSPARPQIPVINFPWRFSGFRVAFAPTICFRQIQNWEQKPILEGQRTG